MNESKYNGLFLPKDGNGAGHLTISGKDTLLNLLTTTPKVAFQNEVRDHHGYLSDGSRASLLQCVREGSPQIINREMTHYKIGLFPHFVLIGEEFLCSHESRIQAIDYTFENCGNLVDGFETFGTIYPAREEFRNILVADHHRRENIAKEKGWQSSNFDIEIGEHPVLQYFSGCFGIAESNADVGSVKIFNRTSHNFGGSRGAHISNEVIVSLEFTNPTNIHGVSDWLKTLHSFFELCLGRRQRYLSIEVQTVREVKSEVEPAPRSLKTYWSYCNDRMSENTKAIHPADVLITPDTHRTEFESVLAKWLDSETSIGEARKRFIDNFRSGRYDINRIIGSANMFDLLPSSNLPSTVELDEQVQCAVEDCRRRFKTLPKSSARESVLSILGRVRKPNLREKILHRARIVTNADEEKFAELCLPCSQAVRCRNHFVHGSEGEFDYRKEIDAFIFLTNSLEFVFAVSHLIELGWDYKSWCRKGSTLSHPFRTYIKGYEMNLNMLKNLIN